jgi:hypothetical protein
MSRLLIRETEIKTNDEKNETYEQRSTMRTYVRASVQCRCRQQYVCTISHIVLVSSMHSIEVIRDEL